MSDIGVSETASKLISKPDAVVVVLAGRRRLTASHKFDINGLFDLSH